MSSSAAPVAQTAPVGGDQECTRFRNPFIKGEDAPWALSNTVFTERRQPEGEPARTNLRQKYLPYMMTQYRNAFEEINTKNSIVSLLLYASNEYKQFHNIFLNEGANPSLRSINSRMVELFESKSNTKLLESKKGNGNGKSEEERLLEELTVAENTYFTKEGEYQATIEKILSFLSKEYINDFEAYYDFEINILRSQLSGLKEYQLYLQRIIPTVFENNGGNMKRKSESMNDTPASGASASSPAKSEKQKQEDKEKSIEDELIKKYYALMAILPSSILTELPKNLDELKDISNATSRKLKNNDIVTQKITTITSKQTTLMGQKDNLKQTKNNYLNILKKVQEIIQEEENEKEAFEAFQKARKAAEEKKRINGSYNGTKVGDAYKIYSNSITRKKDLYNSLIEKSSTPGAGAAGAAAGAGAPGAEGAGAAGAGAGSEGAGTGEGAVPPQSNNTIIFSTSPFPVNTLFKKIIENYNLFHLKNISTSDSIDENTIEKEGEEHRRNVSSFDKSTKQFINNEYRILSSLLEKYKSMLKEAESELNLLSQNKNRTDTDPLLQQYRNEKGSINKEIADLQRERASASRMSMPGLGVIPSPNGSEREAINLQIRNKRTQLSRVQSKITERTVASSGIKFAYNSKKSFVDALKSHVTSLEEILKKKKSHNETLTDFTKQLAPYSNDIFGALIQREKLRKKLDAKIHISNNFYELFKEDPLYKIMEAIKKLESFNDIKDAKNDKKMAIVRSITKYLNRRFEKLPTTMRGGANITANTVPNTSAGKANATIATNATTGKANATLVSNASMAKPNTPGNKTIMSNATAAVKPNAPNTTAVKVNAPLVKVNVPKNISSTFFMERVYEELGKQPQDGETSAFLENVKKYEERLLKLAQQHFELALKSGAKGSNKLGSPAAAAAGASAAAAGASAAAPAASAPGGSAASAPGGSAGSAPGGAGAGEETASASQPAPVPSPTSGAAPPESKNKLQYMIKETMITENLIKEIQSKFKEFKQENISSKKLMHLYLLQKYLFMEVILLYFILYLR